VQALRNTAAFYGSRGVHYNFHEPVTCPYPEPVQSTPPCIISPTLILILLTPYFIVFLVASFLPAFPLTTYIYIYIPLLPHLCYMLCPSYPSLRDIHFILDEEYKLCSCLLCSFLHLPVTTSLFGPNILLSALFSNTLSLYMI
jgi:hypothetical protein